MKNKTCVITGANSGIGYETSLSLAKMGAKILMICRNKEKGEKAKSEIIKLAENSNVDLFIADFSSQKQIRELSKTLNESYEYFDVLINNAGAINTERFESEDNYELTFAVNHLGYFLFSNLLLPKLRNAPKARIVNVVSAVEKISTIFWNDLNLIKNFSGFKAYCQSKLANVIFTYTLANNLKDTNITVNCLHPGAVATNFSGNTNGLFHILFKLGKPFLRSAIKGSETVVWLASSCDVEGISGKYFHNKKEIKSQSMTYNLEVQKRLWDLSVKMVDL
jgi:NAD(P)-dependent dehydrogenase (short-subunit alcohol dehydrogenase family)